MNNVRKLAVGALLALLVFGVWSVAVRSQDDHSRERSSADALTMQKEPPVQSTPTPPPTPQAKGRVMSAEEKLVRDVYARLMRYQTAARDEFAAKNGIESHPEDYLTLELRGIHTGPISDIYDRQLSELVTAKSGEIVNIKPNHLTNGDGPAHAYYDAEWISASGDENAGDSVPGKGIIRRPVKPTAHNGETIENPAETIDSVSPVFPAKVLTIRELLLRGGRRLASVEKYTTYEVTVRLNGKQRTYRALVLHFGRNEQISAASIKEKQADTPAKATAEILDNITAEINTVLSDESPRMRSPWNKYVNTSLYREISKSIEEKKASGQPLIPADAPVGYLPGDDVKAVKSDMHTLDVCYQTMVDIYLNGKKVSGKTVTVAVGQKISLTTQASPPGASIDSPQWMIPGIPIAKYEPSATKADAPTQLSDFDLKKAGVDFYWFDAANGRQVQFSGTVNGTPVTQTVTFKVKVPNPATPTVTLPTNGQLYLNTLTGCENNSGGLFLVFGNVSGPAPGCAGATTGQAGILFTPPGTGTPPITGTTSSPDGVFFFVQLVTGDITTYTRTNATLRCTGTPGLDGAYPYQLKRGQPVNDAPESGLIPTYTTSSRNFGATMYMMWQSNTKDSIPIPMGSVQWGFSASSTQSNGQWSQPSDKGSAQPFAQASGISSFPTWTGLAVPGGGSNCRPE